jgi:hypothetical protein
MTRHSPPASLPEGPGRSPITLVEDLPAGALERLLEPRGLAVAWISPGAPIPGSYWGPPEAGLVGQRLHLRADTPVHSALHEACHWLCMDAKRRVRLHTDAGGDDAEECAVCYLSVLLAGRLEGYDAHRMLADMDAWGYTFRLGCARAWFESDAADALAWLRSHGPRDAVREPPPPRGR